VVLLVSFWAGLPALVPIYLVLTGLAIFEYAAMLRLRAVRVHRTALLVATVAHVPVALPAGHPLALQNVLSLPAREALGLAFLLAILTAAIRRPHRDALSTVGYTLLGYLWIPAFFSYLLTLRVSPDPAIGLATLLLPSLAAVASDVGGWTVGRAVGRRPLSPDLSPDKTIEGALGGLALAAVVTPAAAWALTAWGPGSPISPFWALPFGLLVAFSAQVGDLFESLVKRWAGVKDAGLFLPGQGGVLDRIDSHLFALPLAYLVLTLGGAL
jgi:phosphatidate cytidylyltransferase